MIVDKPNLVMEKILDLQTTGIGSHIRREFLVIWKVSSEEDSWEMKDSLWRWKQKTAKYDMKLRRITGLSRVTMTLGGGEYNTHRLL